MKRYILPLCFLLLFVFTSGAFAQLSVGVAGGWAKNYLYTNVGYRVFTHYAPATGFSVSVPIRYSVNGWLAVQAEPQFIQKNYQLRRTGYYDGIYSATTNQYLQLPLIGHVSFGGPRVKGFLNLGGYAGYWAAGANEGVTPNIDHASEADTYAGVLEEMPAQHFNEPYAFDSRKDRRLELGWLAGTGLSYQTVRCHFFVEGRYYQASSDQQKNYMLNQIPRYNQTFLVQIGCLYRLNLN